MMRPFKSVLLGSAMAVGASAAQADTINFSQFLPNCNSFASPLAGTTVGGDGVTLTSPTGSFQEYVEDPHTVAGCTWLGVFPVGAPILAEFGSGNIGLSFANPITSLTVAAQANSYGSYIETEQAYDGLTLVATDSAAAFNAVATSQQSTVTFLTVTAPDITNVVISVTNDGQGMALYGGAGAPPKRVPEPASAALFVGALTAFGAWRRRRRS